MDKLPPYIEVYRSTLRYRRRVPADVAGWVGRGSWLHVFKPGTAMDVIERVANEITTNSDRLIREGRQRRDVPLENRLAAIEARLGALETPPVTATGVSAAWHRKMEAATITAA